MAQNMNQANIGLLGAWRAAGNTGDLPAGWNGPGGDASSGGNSASSYDPIAAAGSLLQFQKTANAPVAATLGSNVPGIQQQYSDLVNTIKLGSQTSANSATLNTNNEFALRGITGGGAYNTSMANAQLPISAAYSGQLASANAGSIQDLQGLALQIAQLQAGDPNVAIGNALQLGGIQNQAALLPSQIAEQQAQAGFYGQQGGYYGALGSLLGGANRPTLQQLTNNYPT